MGTGFIYIYAGLWLIQLINKISIDNISLHFHRVAFPS